MTAHPPASRDSAARPLDGHYVRPDRFHNHDHDKMNEQDRQDHLLQKGSHHHKKPGDVEQPDPTEEARAEGREEVLRLVAVRISPEWSRSLRAALSGPADPTEEPNGWTGPARGVDDPDHGANR